MYCPKCKPEDKTPTWRAINDTVLIAGRKSKRWRRWSGLDKVRPAGEPKAVVIMCCGAGHTFSVDRPPNDANGNPPLGF